MKSTAEYLFSPERAAQTALSLLEQWGGLTAAAVWSRVDEGWQRLAAIGDAELLVDAAALEAGREAPPQGGALALVSGDAEVGWLVWRGTPSRDVGELASLLSGHLVCARLRAELAVSRVTHETLLEISQLAGEGGTLDAFLPRLHQCVSRLMDATNFQIALYDEEAGALRYPFFRDSTTHEAPSPTEFFTLGSSRVALIAHLIRHARPLVLTRDNIRALGAHAGFAPGVVPRFWLGVPLFNAAGGVLGAVVVQGYDDQRPFSAAEQSLFLFVARHIGFALNKLLYRAHLERQVWLRTGELEGANARLRSEVAERQRAEKMQAMLFRIAELSNTSLSLEAFLAGLHRMLAELVPAANCLVALYHAGEDLLTFPYCADEFSPQLQPRRPGRGLIEQVLHSGRALLTHGGSVDLSDASVPPVSGWLGVPLYCDHELMGVLSVHSYDTQTRYGYRDQELLEFVANHIGAALARVRALEDLQVAYAELEQRVRERTSELDAVNAQLEFDSLHDPLTKLPNRTYFGKALRRAWDSYCNGGERFAVLFIDLDRFKLVNDTLGHLAGDHMLYEAGARVRSCLRHYDFLARLGGDEFAVLLFGVGSFEGCEPTARRIVNEFDRPIILSGREVFTSASVGVVLADAEHYHRAEDLLRDADHAMYRTKQQGRHGYTLFNHELRRNQADQLALESELRRALDEEEQLVPYFQPFVDAQSGALVGFESLVRWRHPERGLISPAVFLPMAEESGLVTRLDRYMIDRACRQLVAWRAEGRRIDQLSLHLNLSSANFHDPGLVDWLTELVTQYALPPDTLHLEITESALIDVPDIAVTVMQALTRLGIRLALDDFGTGYSALSYLHRYHFDVLKIDQAFVAEVDRKEESEAIVRAILALAAALGLDVVAEGVETAAQMHKLREMGCAKLQGFYFAAPAPADAIDWGRLVCEHEEAVGVA
ncbi:EAL domain-containing protein [Crenobacter cavernae]|uniref:EAL domain-containing protein n=1 Tax=Crenobacter cavernae TaxID=2290923 RepID=A0ABY0FDW1_9NEIS|nr:EAL domain-containing protein [Crenobacter cavernae]RXZ44426.1 EAL domain-containing protein [Crenobacter cavernae]